MNIRRATTADAEGVAKVQVDSWHSTYQNIVPVEYLNNMTYESREQKWKAIIKNQFVCLAENVEGRVIGFANGGPARTTDYPEFTGELYAIYILNEFQGQGIGKHLFEAVIDHLKKQNMNSVLVFVLEDNRNKGFYEKLGSRKLDTLEIEIAGRLLKESVYGWENISSTL
ncbi:GNAT family N-acetyltransferase [Halobacillus fulvus]|nr:GNAT family N-acetyltransferase [Halobacillus fulvus]